MASFFFGCDSDPPPYFLLSFLLFVHLIFVAIVVVSGKLFSQWLLWAKTKHYSLPCLFLFLLQLLLWVKMKHCWNCWQLHYQGFSCITIVKFSVVSLFSLWSSSWCSSKLSSQWSSCVVGTCFFSYPPCTCFFSLLDPDVPSRFPFPSPILRHWC